MMMAMTALAGEILCYFVWIVPAMNVTMPVIEDRHPSYRFFGPYVRLGLCAYLRAGLIE